VHLDVLRADPVHATDLRMTLPLDDRQAIEELEPQLGNRGVVRADRPQRVLQDARCRRIAVESHADIADAILHAITRSARAAGISTTRGGAVPPWHPLVDGIKARRFGIRREARLRRSEAQT
jgi:hypothetical protein